MEKFGHNVGAALASQVDVPEPSIPRRCPEVDALKLDALVGTYQSYSFGDFEITRENRLLKIDIPLLDAMGLTYKPWLEGTSTRMWKITIEGRVWDLNFVDGPDGALYTVSRFFGGVRPAPDQPAPLRRQIRLADVEATFAKLLSMPIDRLTIW